MKLLKTVHNHVLNSTLKSSLGKYHIISSLFMDGWKCDRISDLETEVNSSSCISWYKGFFTRLKKKKNKFVDIPQLQRGLEKSLRLIPMMPVLSKWAQCGRLLLFSHSFTDSLVPSCLDISRLIIYLTKTYWAPTLTGTKHSKVNQNLCPQGAYS